MFVGIALFGGIAQLISNDLYKKQEARDLRRQSKMKSGADLTPSRKPDAVPLPAPTTIHNIACPHCRGVLAVTPAHFGRTLGCPHCKQSFLLPPLAKPV
jgi:hypothetical protein